MQITIAGAFVYGSLYLTGVFAYGIIAEVHLAVVAALIGAGAAYVSQFAGYVYETTDNRKAFFIARAAAFGSMAVSVGSGAIGGFALL